MLYVVVVVDKRFAVMTGIVQGITELLPVSSTIHIKIASVLFFGGFCYDKSTALMLHLGSFVVFALYFWRDNVSIIRHLLRRNWTALCNTMLYPALVATLSTVVMTVLFHESVHHRLSLLSTSYVSFVATLVSCVVMYVADRICFSGSRISLVKAVVVGVCQFAASIEGVSRLGVVITVCRLLGISRAESVRFSMFLAMPAILGDIVYSLLLCGVTLRFDSDSLFAMLCVMLSGLIFICPCSNILAKRGYFWLVCYRVFVAFVILVLDRIGW